VAIEAADRRLIYNGGRRRPKLQDVAIANRECFADTARAREFRVLPQMPRFAVHRNGDLRPDPTVHVLELIATRMAGDVHERFTVGNYIDAKVGQPASDARYGFFIAGNGARGEDDEIAFIERDIRMFVFRDARHCGARLTSTAGAQNDNLVARQ
ncbi:hypothetical protein OY671_012046, partial [Metschnikowia pulcherrima]